MKKLILIVLLILGLTGLCFAQDTPKAFELQGMNLQGDTLYLAKSRDLTVGVGYDIAKFFDGLFNLRIEAAGAFEGNFIQDGLVGAGVGIDIQKAIKALKGEWILPKDLTPSIGFLNMFKITDRFNYEPTFYLTIINKRF